jgi:hypothetical protein
MNAYSRLLALAAAAGALLMPGDATRAQLLNTGNDEKVTFDENAGKTITHPAGKDTVSIIDIADPAKPKIVVNLPLMNTITGPPVNLAITPDQHLALVANSLDWVKDGDAWKGDPDNKIYVIDLTASPPGQIGTVEAGKQASGMAINHAGTLALVANRADDQIGSSLDHFLRSYDAILGCGLISAVGEDVDAAGDLDELRDPSNSGDQRIVPFLEEYSWPARQALRAASDFGQTRFERSNELPSPFARIDHRAQHPNHTEDSGDASLIEGMDVEPTTNEIRRSLPDKNPSE